MSWKKLRKQRRNKKTTIQRSTRLTKPATNRGPLEPGSASEYGCCSTTEDNADREQSRNRPKTARVRWHCSLVGLLVRCCSSSECSRRPQCRRIGKRAVVQRRIWVDRPQHQIKQSRPEAP